MNGKMVQIVVMSRTDLTALVLPLQQQYKVRTEVNRRW